MGVQKYGPAKLACSRRYAKTNTPVHRRLRRLGELDEDEHCA
jgi:hypothetical protein